MSDDVSGFEDEDPDNPEIFVVNFSHFSISTVPPIPGSIVVNAGNDVMVCSSLYGAS